MPLHGWSGWVRYGLPGMLFGAVLSCWLGGREPSARAQQPGVNGTQMSLPQDRSRQGGTPPATETGGTIAFSSPAGVNGQLLYLIDTRSRAFAVYRVDPSNPKGTVKLEASRQYQWDLKLSDYNNLDPRPDAIESMTRGQGAHTSR